MLPQYEQIKVGFPLGKFLYQILFDTGARTWNPMKFWFKYKVDLLERCLALNALEGNVR